MNPSPFSMSQMLALSFDSVTSPTITLSQGDNKQTTPVTQEYRTGWGVGWYPGEDRGAALIKHPFRKGPKIEMAELLNNWDRFRGTQFLCHFRGAAKMASQQDTQPFDRSFAGRDWLFAHNGHLERGFKDTLVIDKSSPFEPVGLTDSEHIFCWLLNKIYTSGARSLADVGWLELHDMLRYINRLGSVNITFADGENTIAYRDQRGFNALHYCRVTPPHPPRPLKNSHLEVRIDHALDDTRTMFLVSTTPLSQEGWTSLDRAQMIVANRGNCVWTSPSHTPLPFMISDKNGNKVPKKTSRILRVFHETKYEYDGEIERSSHLFRLRPVHDLAQAVISYKFSMTPHHLSVDYEDVFGNLTTPVELNQTYSTLKMTAQSTVRIHAPPKLSGPNARTTIPLVWMPWQRQMMLPYLLPPELPETQLRELSDFAMSFVERQDYDLIRTLVDLNQSIYRDFSYVSGSTTLATTPFEVYTKREGVCQDFANLFICLARLMGVPARYRVGYIYTGANYTNKIQSEASHAWAEVYLPWLGWHGFDPTNGILAGLDHVRIACGRNYRDAAPTSGTIFKGGGDETLSVVVRVEEVAET